ncbi:MAG: hypothetical protein ACJ735_11550 [Actinomycetes bacterium]
MRTTKLLALASAGAAALVVVSACGSSGGSSPAAQNPKAGSNPGQVKLQSTSLGSVLANGSGRTLYLLTSDGAKLGCTGACLSIWQPLMASGGAPVAAPGVTGMLSTVSRGSDKQVTISGHPLYTYTGDSSSGQTTGQGVKSYGGTWWVLDASGAAVTSSAGASSSASANPYGY